MVGKPNSGSKQKLVIQATWTKTTKKILKKMKSMKIRGTRNKRNKEQEEQEKQDEAFFWSDQIQHLIHW